MKKSVRDNNEMMQKYLEQDRFGVKGELDPVGLLLLLRTEPGGEGGGQEYRPQSRPWPLGPGLTEGTELDTPKVNKWLMERFGSSCFQYVSLLFICTAALCHSSCIWKHWGSCKNLSYILLWGLLVKVFHIRFTKVEWMASVHEWVRNHEIGTLSTPLKLPYKATCSSLFVGEFH